MNQRQVNKILTKAQQICTVSGGRLTDKRKSVLATLLRSKTPLSAYEIADAYNQSVEAKMPAMSVYRILDFLESEQLVHKLSSTNKYTACSHITCDHAHKIPQFLICGSCEKVNEIYISSQIIEELEEQVSESGYQLTNSQLELQCICDDCASKTLNIES